MHIDQALELVKRVPGSMELLTVGLLPTEGGQDPTPAIPQADPTMVQAIDHSQHVEGEIPPEIPEERDISTHMSLALGLQNQEVYSRYLQGHEQLDPIPVEAMGNCMFSSVRRAIDVPLEYQNVHLRRQIVMVLANNCNFFMPLPRNSLMATYGHPRMEQEEYDRRYEAGQLSQQQIDDQDCPGPFSFWLIWFINQRALCNHELSIMHHHHWCQHCWHWHRHLCTPPSGTGLDIETSYLVHICTYIPHICSLNIL